MYIILFIVFAEIVHRFKINNFAGMALLSSVYGLILEGVFANTIFDPTGFVPNILGIRFIHDDFTALTWHPIMDFFFAFVVFKMLLRGKFNLSDKKFYPKEIIFMTLFSFFYFIWSCARWLRVKFPLGVPTGIKIFAIIYPLVLFGFFFILHLSISGVFSGEKNYWSESIFFYSGFFPVFCVSKI